MKVLLTGAFGNIGSSTLEELINQGYQVRCFDLQSPENEKTSKKYKDKIEVIWGNLTSTSDVEKAVSGVEAVIHMGYIIPPLSEKDPKMSYAVNVGGTKNVIKAMEKQIRPPKLLFISSISVFGPTQSKKPPRTADEPVAPADNYSKHKILCEKMVKESKLEWSIIRFPAVPPIKVSGMDPMMFSIPLETRIELCHTKDAGLAAANILKTPTAWGKILLIGGGAKCQTRYGDYLKKMLEATGIGMLPEEAFGDKEYYTDWVDTTESEKLLDYQRHDLDDIINDLAKLIGWKKYLTFLMRPLVRAQILKLSPYYKK